MCFREIHHTSGQMRKRVVNKKTIRSKLLKTSIAIIAVSLLVVGGTSSLLNYNSTEKTLEQTMVETAKLAAHTVTHEMEGYERLAQEVAYNPVFLSDTSTREDIVAECKMLAERNGLYSVGLADAEGKVYETGDLIADREYFKEAKDKKTTYVSDPIIRKDNGDMNIIISAPVIKGDQFKGVVFLGADASVLCEIVNGIQIGETGNASIINNTGDTIGYSDVQLVLDQYNTQDDLKNDPTLAQLAAVERKVMAGESGFDDYSYGGVSKYAAYSPIEGTPGWGIYVAVAKNEFLASTYLGIAVVVGLLALTIICAVILMIRFAKSIVNPIKMCVDRIRLLAAGDIHSEIPIIKTGDETQILAENMGSLIENMKRVIGDIDYCLGEMSQGNFKVHSKEHDSYIGDFENILISERKLKENLRDTLKQIMESTQQVSFGADQMSQNAQTLAEGATEQASAVEELNATVAEVSNAAKTSAEIAEETSGKVLAVAKEAEGSNEKMKELIQAMERISATSKDIENIISEIEDIASQTNLLSLNASIEAARAGDAGRGFAVVAEQIGKLATDSAQSAVNTKALIEKSLQEIEMGNAITEKVVGAVETIIEEMRSFAGMADETSNSSRAQAKTLAEVEQGIEQISDVIQSNSASAEETSATSEELSAQSENMTALVNRFQC